MIGPTYCLDNHPLGKVGWPVPLPWLSRPNANGFQDRYIQIRTVSICTVVGPASIMVLLAGLLEAYWLQSRLPLAPTPVSSWDVIWRRCANLGCSLCVLSTEECHFYSFHCSTTFIFSYPDRWADLYYRCRVPAPRHIIHLNAIWSISHCHSRDFDAILSQFWGRFCFGFQGCGIEIKLKPTLTATLISLVSDTGQISIVWSLNSTLLCLVLCLFSLLFSLPYLIFTMAKAQTSLTGDHAAAKGV